MALAEKIIEVKIGLDVEAVAKAVEKLQQEADDHERAVLKLNPKDAEALRAIGQKNGVSLTNEKIVRVEPDDSVPQGCARLDTEFSLLEVDYRQQLDKFGEFFEMNNSEIKAEDDAATAGK